MSFFKPGVQNIFFHPARILLFTFALGILVGAIILKLPISSANEPVSWVDAFFTSTSAMCVTGLAVKETGTQFSGFGHGVILALIQIGGLGITTFSSFFVLLFGRSLSFRDRFMAKEALLGEISYLNLFSLIKNILAVAFVVEFIAAMVLSLRFAVDMPVSAAIKSGIFHSISAYCNAGFSLFPDSLLGYSGDFTVNLVILSLIVLGGIGFPVIYELMHKVANSHKFEFSRLSLHCKLVLVTTVILIVGGAVLLYLFELGNPMHHRTFSGITVTEAFFQSITARTAGFNSINIDKLTNPSIFILIMLMFIGASPASSGGGIKTTTFAIFLALIRAKFLGREKVEVFKRTLPNEAVFKSLTLIVGSMMMIILVNIILQMTETRFVPHSELAGTFLETLFEAISAFGTVGLSMGLTPNLTFLGKLVIMAVMFIGRVGPLTFAVAITIKSLPRRFEYPEDSAMIG